MSERRAMEVEIKRFLYNIGQNRLNQDKSQPTVEEAVPLRTDHDPEPTEIIHVYFVKEEEEEQPGEYEVDSTLAAPASERSSFQDAGESRLYPTSGDLRRALIDSLSACASVFLLLLCIVCEILITLTAQVPAITLVPRVHNLSTTAIITAVPGTPTRGQIAGRLLPSFTLIQFENAPATGKGHQDAKVARGTITFYNGQFSSQTVAVGTSLSGSDGVEVVTDRVAMIPAGIATTPPLYGQVTVPAHAFLAGPQGNIRAREINEACCQASVLAQNTVAFHGGQNERDYPVVVRVDIDNAVSRLASTLTREEQAAFMSKLTAEEALVTPACRSVVALDHLPGEEATSVKVAVTERCVAIAYQRQSLCNKATLALTQQVLRMLGTHYRLIGAVRVQVLRTALRDIQGRIATVSVRVGGTWMYQFDRKDLEMIKVSIAGQTLRQAQKNLLGLAGIRRIEIDGIEGNDRLPKSTSGFRILVLGEEISSEREVEGQIN